MSRPKQHHFVPEWYLSQFADEDGFLHVYDKLNGLWRRQRPRKVMRRNGYYKQDWVPEGIDPNILEQQFGQRLEPGAKVAFEKLLAWEEELSLEEWALIMIYIEVQRLRVPRQANVAKELLRSFILVHGRPSAAEAILKGKLTLRIADSFRFDFLRMMGGSLIRYFMRMEWEIVRSDDASLITTDNPVTLINIAVKPPEEPGIALAGTIVLFPINPHRLFDDASS